MPFIQAFTGVFSLILVVALGFALAKLGWFSESTRKLIPRLVTNVTLPPFLACTIVSSFQRDSLTEMIRGPVLPFLAMATLFCGAWIVARLFHVDKKHFGLFCVCVSNPNTIFIGIPVNQALFGPESLRYVLLYYFASTFFFWSVGNYFLSRDPKKDGSVVATGKFRLRWQNLISAPLIGFFCGITIVCMDWHIPGFLFRSGMLVGEMTTPLALIFIGITLEGIGLGRVRITRDVGLALAGRMVASPILVWSLVPLFDLPELMGKVFIVQSSLPVIMSVAILSAYYNTDADYGSVMVAISTILCVLTIPVYVSLM